jgi:hypothetical protein
LLALCPAIPSAAVRPAEGEVVVETSVDRDSVLFADPLIYTIDVLAPADLLVQPPPAGQQLGPFEVRDVQFLPPEPASEDPGGPSTGETPGRERAGETPEEEGAGPQRTRIRWSLVPYRAGRLEIPALPVVVADTSGTADTLLTAALPVEVASLEPDLQGDIRDIKPPEALPRGWAWLGWPIGGLILLAAGLWLLRFLRRRRLQRGLEEIPYQGPPRPAHLVAMEELDRIAALRLLDKGLVKEHYIQVSDAIRRYSEGRYALGAMELTTWELIREMKRTAVPEDDRRTFRTFLEECDLVKFAKHIPPTEVRETLLDRARRLVRMTRIPDPPETLEETQNPATRTQPAGVAGS